jgi:Asp/Glu/hydantoin racemase
MTISIRAVTPIDVSAEEVSRRQRRYDALSPEGIRVVLENLPGSPTQLDSASACRASEAVVVAELLQTDPGQYDAVLADCVLDPALETLEQRCPVPVFGILKLCCGVLAAAGHRFGAVARNQAIADELEARVLAHGHADRFDRVAVLDLALQDIDRAERWNEVLGTAARAFESSATSVLINGCSAVDVLPRAGSTVAVVDPTALALATLGLMVARGLPLPKSAHRASALPAR